MSQEDRELLLKDLCGRLPYFTKVQIENEIVILDSICDDDGYYFNFIGDDREGVNIENIKPYLFPISSMTEEQKKFFNNLPIGIDKYGDISTKDDLSGNSLYTDLELYLEVIDWLNANHFDYRGLIEKGLAIDATNKNIYTL